MCSDQVVWNVVAKEIVLPCLWEALGHTVLRLLNVWGPHGYGEHAVLATIAALLTQDANVDRIETVEIEQVDAVLADSTMLGRRTVVLAQGLDRVVGTDVFHALEIQLATHLLTAHSVVLVLVTNMPMIPWSTSEFWQRTTNVQIGSLEPEYTRLVTQACQRDPITAWVQTFGYAAALHEWFVNPGLGAGTIAADVFAETVEGCTAATQKLVQVASLLPFFNVAALRYVNGDRGDDDETYVQYTRSLNELLAIGVIVWDMDAGWYRFTDGGLRRLMARKIAADRRDKVAELRERALRYFGAEAVHPAFLQYCFVSAIYHLVANFPAATGEEAGQLCLKWIDHAKGGWQGADRYAVLRSWQVGGGDWQVKDELQSRLGVDGFDRITRAIGEALETKP